MDEVNISNPLYLGKYWSGIYLFILLTWEFSVLFSHAILTTSQCCYCQGLCDKYAGEEEKTLSSSVSIEHHFSSYNIIFCNCNFLNFVYLAEELFQGLINSKSFFCHICGFLNSCWFTVLPKNSSKILWLNTMIIMEIETTSYSLIVFLQGGGFRPNKTNSGF